MHECIHAYLLTISSYPLVGMDIAEVINKVLPTPKEQHDFMYNNMLPVMTKVFTEIRDLVTSEPRRVDVSDLKIYTKVDKSAFEIWNWTNFYECISINGLEEANFYKVDYPNASDALFLWKPDSADLQSVPAIISNKANTKDKKTSIFAGTDCKSALSYTTDFFHIRAIGGF